MTDKELERKLADALSHAAPDDLEGVLSRCETRKGNVIPMTSKKKRPVIRGLIAACLALVLIGGVSGVYQSSYAVASIVSLDVNPSIELKVNKREKILTCTGLNQAGQEVLADMAGGADLEGIKLDVAVNAIVGALVRYGYLDSISSAILISVEDKDQMRADQLRQALTGTVDGVLQQQAANAAVLSQTVAQDDGLEQQARENNISTGKAALVNQVLALNGTLKFDELAALSVEELKDLVETGEKRIPIGKEKAGYLAAQFSGLAAVSSLKTEVDSELDEIPAHYEVTLRWGEMGAEYKVDAFTGEILSGRKNVVSEIPSDSTEEPTPPKVENQQTDAAAGTASDVGADKAKAAALAHAGLTEGQVTGLKVERDRDDGRLEYEVEFKANGMEYEYTISGTTGAVLEYEKDWDD